MHQTCKNCGATNAEDAGFCGGCGTKIEAAVHRNKGIFSARYLILIFLLVISVAGVWYFTIGRSQNYYPLGIGMQWDYQVTGAPNVSRLVITNLPPREMDGHQVIPRKLDAYSGPNSASLIATSFDFVYEDKDGIHFYAFQNYNAASPTIYGASSLFLKYPIQLGETWGKSGDIATTSIEGVDDVITVPAGNFQNVVETKSGNSDKTWYAPKVGMIMEVSTDNSGKQIIAKLTNFKD